MEEKKVQEIVIGGVYKHFKGKYYKCLSVVFHSETNEEMVVYQQLYGDYKIWVTTGDRFIEYLYDRNLFRFDLVIRQTGVPAFA